ncbi:hypothetical protein FCH33_06930 [Serratia fonticola]|uniref:hypothetical protein n=1 Tax=Serratia fonticola TaxID=47917 RepID=UPI0015757FE9|nr:hypothetical protein [Serratia fonticola]NTY86504.1 hypothetical protein [Serratia fonticola]NTZ12389.1 hypothetical protein [Serratia fonticola]
MVTKDKIDVGKVRKEATKKVGFLLKELNKNLPGITEGSAAGAGATNSNLLSAMSKKQIFCSQSIGTLPVN